MPVFIVNVPIGAKSFTVKRDFPEKNKNGTAITQDNLLIISAIERFANGTSQYFWNIFEIQATVAPIFKPVEIQWMTTVYNKKYK